MTMINKSMMALAFVLGVVCSVGAQERHRSRASYMNGARTCIVFHDGSSTFLEWSWKIGGAQSGGQIQIPSAVTGGVTLVAQDRVLLSGLSGNQGWLMELSFSLSGGTVVVQSSTISVGALDLVKLSYQQSSGLLFSVNNATREVWVSQYQAGLQLGPWQVAATAAQCPTLNKSNNWLVLTPLPANAGVQLAAREPWGHLPHWRISQDSNGVWTALNPAVGIPPTVLPPTWVASAFTLMAPDSSEYRLWIGGGSGQFWIVDHVTGAPVFTGTHSGAPAGEHISIPFAALELGRMYYVDSGPTSGYQRSSLFRAEAVWRRASVDPNMVPTKVGIRTDFPVVGTDFVAWELHWSSSQPQPTAPMLLTMYAGAWDYGIDPTVHVPSLGVDLLALSYGDLGAQVAYWDNRGMVSFGWAISVNNPIFVGLKVAVQAVGVLPTGQFITSDVAGVQMVQ
jgi:hypothetical protein